MGRIIPLICLVRPRSIPFSIHLETQTLRTQTIITKIIPSSSRVQKRQSSNGSGRAGPSKLQSKDLQSSTSPQQSSHLMRYIPASKLFTFSPNNSQQSKIIDLRDPNLSTESQPSNMALNQPRTDKVEPLATDDAKWIAFKKIHWTDGHGRARVWEAAARTTRGSSGIDAVCIAPIILQKGKPASTLIILQYRPPVDAVCVEFPAGLIDAKETVEEAAARELREETGFEKIKIVESGAAIANDPGMSMSNMALTVAEVYMDEGEELPEQHLDEGEEIERIVVPLKDLYNKLEELQKEGKMVDARLWHWAVGVKLGAEHKSWF